MARTLLALVGLASPAMAQTEVQTYSVTVPPATTAYTTTVQLPGFDPELGILRQVSVTEDIELTGSAAFESLDSMDSMVSNRFSASSSLFLSGDSTPLVSVLPSQTQQYSVTAFDGVTDFGGTSGITVPNLLVTDSATSTLPPATSSMVAFATRSDVDIDVVVVGTSTGSGAGNLILSFSQMASVGVTVQYDYSLDCNENGMPDEDELLLGTSPDLDLNQVPDECDGTGLAYCFGNGGVSAMCTSCPCGNDGAPGTLSGCLNGTGVGAFLRASGQGAVNTDTLSFEMVGANPSTFAVLFSANNAAPSNSANPCFGLDSGVQSTMFDGLRCAVGGVQRSGTQSTDASGEVGTTTSAWGASGGLIAQGGFVPGQTVHYQVIYREALTLGCGTGQNTTNGIRIEITP